MLDGILCCLMPDSVQADCPTVWAGEDDVGLVGFGKFASFNKLERACIIHAHYLERSLCGCTHIWYAVLFRAIWLCVDESAVFAFFA